MALEQPLTEEHQCELPDVSDWLFAEGDLEFACPVCGTRYGPAYGSGPGDSSGWVRIRR